MPKNDQIWPKIGIFGRFGPGHADFFGALLVGQLVVVARGLYLARHLITLFSLSDGTNFCKTKYIGQLSNWLACQRQEILQNGQ